MAPGDNPVRGRVNRLWLAFAVQPQLRVMGFAKSLEDRQITFRQRRGVPQQHRIGRTAEQLDMPQRLRFAQTTKHGRQRHHDRLQGLYQHRALFDGDDVLTRCGAESDVQSFRLHVPAHGNAGAAAIAEFMAGQRRAHSSGSTPATADQLLGEHALFQGKLFGVGHLLDAATAATAEMRARRRAAHGAGLEHALGTGLDHFAVGAEYPRLDLFAGQSCP